MNDNSDPFCSVNHDSVSGRHGRAGTAGREAGRPAASTLYEPGVGCVCGCGCGGGGLLMVGETPGGDAPVTWRRFRSVTNSVLRLRSRCCRCTASFEEDASEKHSVLLLSWEQSIRSQSHIQTKFIRFRR